MLIQTKIRQYLSTKTALVELVGTRIYPGYLPDSVVYPAISYSRVSNVRPRVKDGHIKEARPRFQFDVWAESYLEAGEIERHLIAALDNLTIVDGVFHSEYAGGHEVFEQEVKLHHFIVEYFILYKE
jgi:hypothetical protein